MNDIISKLKDAGYNVMEQKDSIKIIFNKIPTNEDEAKIRDIIDFDYIYELTDFGNNFYIWIVYLKETSNV